MSNCIDMNVDTNGNFNIYPSPIINNNVSNISILNKNKEKTLAKFDMNNNNIYLGGNDENAGMLINESNVYLKNINFLTSGTKYSDAARIYNKTINDPDQNYNKYLYNTDDIIKINRLFININGIYTIIKSTDPAAAIPYTLIINFKSSIEIPANKKLIISIDELNNISTGTTIINNEITTQPYISNALLDAKNITLSIAKIIPDNTNVRVKLTDTKITIPDTYSEPYIVNTFTTTIT